MLNNSNAKTPNKLRGSPTPKTTHKPAYSISLPASCKLSPTDGKKLCDSNLKTNIGKGSRYTPNRAHSRQGSVSK